MTRLFGTDGIRGNVGEWPLIPEFFLTLGKAVGFVLSTNHKPATMVVGRDTRRSGQMLQAALTAGLLSGGVKVIDLGEIPTSGIAWVTRHLHFDAGAVISASHNPIEQNGIKFINREGLKFPEALEDEVEKVCNTQTSLSNMGKNWNNLGDLRDGKALHELYKASLLSEHLPRFLEGLKVLVDCANGAASEFAPEVLSKAGAQVVAIHSSTTGDNINKACGSEFARRYPAKIHQLINEFEVDFGISFDGDADRVVFVDESGNLIDGDHMLGFLARYLHQSGRLVSNVVVTTQMRNTGLKNYLESLGIQMIETPVGDKYVVEKIQELRKSAIMTSQGLGLGGEQAGHIDLVNDDFTTGDGIRTALFVLQAYLDSGASSLSEFAAGVGKTPQIIASAFVGSGARMDKRSLADLETEIMNNNPGLIRLNLRYSGTEPLFRTMIESDGSINEDGLAKIAYQVSRLVQNHAQVGDEFIDILNCTRGGILDQSGMG